MSAELAEVHLSPRDEKHMNIPPEGILLPILVTLPNPTQPVASIQQTAIQMGFNIPRSYTRQETIGRIRTLLGTLGYRDGEAPNQMIRDHPARLLSNETPRALAQAVAISLPAIIDRTVFNTKDSLLSFITENNLRPYIPAGQGRLKADLARDLRTFLAERNYAINPRGDFVREAPLEIAGGYEYQDLIRPDNYVQFLLRTESVTISQQDLVKLQLTLQELVALLSRRRWETLDRFAQDVADRMEIDIGLALFVSLLARIHFLTPTEIQGVLTQIGDTTLYKTNKQRQVALNKYVRTRLNLITQSYPDPRNLKTEKASHEDITFDEVIEAGYDFDPEDFRWDIQRNAYVSLAKFHLNFLAQLYRRYPGIYEMSKEYNIRSNTITNKIIELYYDESPSYPQIIYAFTVNYPVNIPEPEERARRRAQLDELPQRYFDTLYGIYRSRYVDLILDEPLNPLELYLAALSKVQLDQLAQFVLGFGMVIPEHLLRAERREYVLREMPSYRDVLSRPKDTPPLDLLFKRQPENFIEFLRQLAPYGDQEIIASFGYQGGFDTREALIDNIYRTMVEEGFMLFQEISTDRATNSETLMLSQLKDILRPYLVFGTPFQYRVLELDELIQSFSGEQFNKIGADRAIYTDSQVSRLQVLLPTMKQTNPQLTTMADQLLKIINSGLVAKLRRSGEVDHLIRILEKQPVEQRELLKRIFYQVFYSGMYMRRWKGPGNRYPVHGVESRGSFDPQPKSILALDDLFKMKSDLSKEIELDELYEIEYHTGSGEITFAGGRLFPFIGVVAEGKHCIRQASRRLVISAWYYIGVLFGEVIPDFSPSDVERIS